MTDPQERARRGQWMSHDGIVWIEDMTDEYLLNCYKTCLRHDNPKAIELLAEIEERKLDWRLYPTSTQRPRRSGYGRQ